MNLLFFEFSVQHQVQSDEVAASAAEIADRRGVVRGFYDRAYVGQVEEVFDTYVQAQERGQLLRDGTGDKTKCIKEEQLQKDR